MEIVAAVEQSMARAGEMVLLTLTVSGVAVLLVIAASAWLERRGF